MLVAIADRFRDARAPDGRPLVVAILEATFDDIRSRARGRWVGMMVDPDNRDGASLVTRLGASHRGSFVGDDVYVVALD